MNDVLNRLSELLEPVSYTHLDVYKRQIMISPMAASYFQIRMHPQAFRCV